MPSRRQFIHAAVTGIAPPFMAGVYTSRFEPHWLEIVERPLPIANLPRELEGRVLAHLSDLHVGPHVDDAYIVDVFRRVAALAPDLVAVTGDFITYSGPGVFSQLEHALDSMPRGRLGTVAILGNHDYGLRWAQTDVARNVVACATRAGATVLRNEATTIAGLTIVGLDDLWAERIDLAAIGTIDPRGASLVLVHNPDSVDLGGWRGHRGWILAGHTHGGQCKPPFLPPPMLPVRNRRYAAGAVELGAGRRLYVSRGVGHHLRVRFNCRPEVTMFQLTRDRAES